MDEQNKRRQFEKILDHSIMASESNQLKENVLKTCKNVKKTFKISVLFQKSVKDLLTKDENN